MTDLRGRWLRAATASGRVRRGAPDPAGRWGQLQVAPLRVNPLGAALLPLWLAWKPMVVEPPGAMAAL